MKRLLIGLLAISFVLTLLPETQANAPDAPSAISRKLLGLQVGKSSYPRWRRNGEDQYGFTFVPRKYQGDFRNVCLYIEWKDYDKESTDKNGNKTQYYNYKKYQKIFDDLVAAGVESIGVCFCPFLPDWVCERIYNDFKDPKRTWEPWLKGWANRYEPKDWWDEKARRINLSYTKNWWSRSLFRFESGSFKQVFEPEENRDKKGNVKWPPFYRNAAHLALPAYEEMVEDFATRFGKYVDFWEPWDEPGWGLNFAPAGVEYDITTKEVPPSKRVCGRSRFSGWPGPYRSVEDGTWIAGDAQKVQASCYETVHEVYGKHAKDKWPSPCVLLASLVGDDMLLNVSPAFFSKEENANVQGNTSSLYYYRDNLEYKDLSLKVSSSRAVVCERPLYVNLPSGYSGGGDSAGSSEPSSQWYFAEGTTREGFEETLNLFNPSKDKITVDVTFMFGDGRGTQQLQVEVNGGCRKDLSVNDRVGSGQDVSVSLKAADNRRFYAERTVNFNYKGVWNGTHCSVGATAPSTTWYFAEGTTRTGFEEWLCIHRH